MRTASGQSDGFFSSSPGPLTKEHAAFDSQSKCNDCHVDNSKAISSDKCLGCHDHSDLKKRIDAGQGYHSSPQVRGRSCETCHLEHKNRDFNIMGWRTVKGGEQGFDHALTGWPLRDKHSVVPCEDCHKQINKGGRRVFLGQEKLCGSCHKDDQPHKFERRAMLACERCHNEIAWKPQKKTLEFDHNNKADAEFPQEGAHADVACGKCHPKSEFNLEQKRPGNCGNSGCHNTAHQGHLFDTKSCDWCHSPKFKTLKQFEFNHRARTRFSLAGAHGKLTCYECHSKKLGTEKPNRACAPCHSDDNPHRDRFKEFGAPVPACETCHPESSWKPTEFDHGKKTQFGLAGKHADVACRACHRGSKPFDWERFPEADHGRRCMGCHQHTNVHNKEFTDQPKSKKVMRDGERVKTCLECHPNGGSVNVKRTGVDSIHGAKGSWPLVMGHAGVACEKCHANKEFADTPKECGVRCHQDSLHKGSLGDLCSKCHTPGTWIASRFDHNTDDTDWPLNGLHSTIPECVDCHPTRDYSNTPRNCSAEGCHAKDDAHKGKLGPKCENCHLETGENVFDHNRQAEYKLDGKHLEVRCAKCHPSITFKPRPQDCYGGGACHPEPEVHKGQFGTACASCHNTKTFKGVRPLHDVGEFRLKGGHEQQPCVACHKNNRALAGTGNFCAQCHRQDDVHSNSLSPRCGECHTQFSFAPARFNHTTVGCNLTGLHRTLPCVDCHKNGNFGGLSPLCYSCHVDDQQKDPTFHGGWPTNCAACHNPNFFSPANTVAGMGQYGSGQESICR